jgi:hypothetical protein
LILVGFESLSDLQPKNAPLTICENGALYNMCGTCVYVYLLNHQTLNDAIP